MCFDDVQGQLPLLQYLFLDCSSQIFCWGWGMKLFEHAPKLWTLEMDMIIDVDDFQIPWHNLTKFVAHGRSTFQFLEILRKASNLVECELTEVADVYADPSTITLLHLQSLRLGYLVRARYLLASLSLPSLRNINLRLLVDDEFHLQWDSQDAFVNMLSRSGCTLHSLSLDFTQICVWFEDLLVCLEASPSLVQLVVKESIFTALTDSVLRLLTPATSGESQLQITCLVPKLEILMLEFERKAFMDEPFAQMVELRWRLGAVGSPLAKLHTIGITLKDEANVVHMEGTRSFLRTLEEEGMTAILKGFKPSRTDLSLVSS